MKINLRKVTVFICILSITFSVLSLSADATEYNGSNILSNNIHDHVYTDNARVSNSYLIVNPNNTFSRIENYGDVILVETYSNQFKLLTQATLYFELSKFGGFYDSGRYYYFVYGQDNYEQNNDKEVIRVAQYNREWKRVGTYSIRNCNTTVPFMGTNTDFCTAGDMLYIRCGHQSYADSNNKLHQGPMTIAINEGTGELSEVQASLEGAGKGSPENVGATFINGANGVLTAVDHCTTNPYGIVVSAYHNNANDRGFQSSCQNVHGLGQYAAINETIYYTFTVSGNSASNNSASSNNTAQRTGSSTSTGNNSTSSNASTSNNNITTTVAYTSGTPMFSIGGYKVSTQYFLVVGTSEPSDTSTSGKNIVIMSVPRNQFTDEAVKLTYLTGFSRMDGMTAETPYIVEIDRGERYCVLWEERSGYSDMCRTYYTYINGAGERLTDVGSIDGCLSDCEPIVFNGQIIWYTTNGASVKLYSINISNTVVNDNVVYNTSGAVYQGVDYSKVYDFAFYCNRYPDIRVLYSNNPSAALAHFVNTGMAEGRQACSNFNVNVYKANYPDLASDYGDSLPSYYYHFMTSGYIDGRNARTYR